MKRKRLHLTSTADAGVDIKEGLLNLRDIGNGVEGKVSDNEAISCDTVVENKCDEVKNGDTNGTTKKGKIMKKRGRGRNFGWGRAKGKNSKNEIKKNICTSGGAARLRSYCKPAGDRGASSAINSSESLGKPLRQQDCQSTKSSTDSTSIPKPALDVKTPLDDNVYNLIHEWHTEAGSIHSTQENNLLNIQGDETRGHKDNNHLLGIVKQEFSSDKDGYNCFVSIIASCSAASVCANILIVVNYH